MEIQFLYNVSVEAGDATMKRRLHEALASVWYSGTISADWKSGAARPYVKSERTVTSTAILHCSVCKVRYLRIFWSCTFAANCE